MKNKVSFNESVEVHRIYEGGEVINGKADDNTYIETNKQKRKKRKLDADDEFEKSDDSIENIVEDEEDDSSTSDNTDVEDNKVVSAEESHQLNGKFLRNAFNTPDGLHVLEKYVTVCNNNTERDLAAEYVEAGGSVLEIIKLLETTEKKNINNACVVFSAMHITIMKILSKYPQSQASAEEACRHLINSHLASVHSMLSSQGKAKHRKIVLKLLAAVVSLGGKLPRELLNHLSLHSQLIEVLVTHYRPTDRENVRTCFIYFMLAFLIEGNASDIRALLDKRGVFSSIFSGLKYDYSETVQLVLKTVKKYILENPLIMKTIKLQVFSTSVIQDIINLYNWKGPKNWSRQTHKKQKLATEYIDEEQKEITVNCVHEFLITLLTSTRHGIAFHDRSLGTDSKNKNNQLIYSILQNLDKPWEHEKPSELIIKILTVCPDLIKSQLSQTESYLVPRVSKKWIAVIHFINKIITNIDVENYLRFCSDITEVQFINAILNLIVPSIVIKNAIIPSLEHDSSIIHHEIIELLLTMVKKIESFVSAFETMNFNVSEKSAYKIIAVEHILKNMPNFESILNIWTKGLSINADDQNLQNEENLCFTAKDHLLSILNLLQAYCEICPEIFLRTTSADNIEKEAIALFTNLDGIENITTQELIIMKVKAIKILLSSNLLGFLPNEDIFGTALSFLFTQIGNKYAASFDIEIRQTIDLLLEKSGVFEGYNDQIEIWVDSITYLQDPDKFTVADWITKIIRRVFKKSEKYTSLILEVEKNTGEEIIDVNAQENFFNELSERNFEDVKFITSMLPITSISSLLYAAIENLKTKSSPIIEHYMSIVLTHTLHCQISSKAFISLVESLDNLMQQYFIGWSDGGLSSLARKSFSSNNIFQKLNTLLLNSDESCKVCSNEAELCIEINGKKMDFSLSDFELKAAFRMVIFYMTQSLQKSKAEMKNNNPFYRETLLSLIKIADKKEASSKTLLNYCAYWIFKHPIVLQYFKGIYINNNAAENLITQLFIDVCHLYFNLNRQCLLINFMHPYQNKLILQSKSVIKKQKSDNDITDVQARTELFELLQLNIKDSIYLLNIIMSLPRQKFLILNESKLSIWVNVIDKLIGQFFTQELRTESGLFVTIHENLVNKLFSYWIELKISSKQNVDLWESSFYTYLLKFPHSISAIDEKTFLAIMKTSLTPKTVQILNLLTERNSKFIATFIKFANENDDIFNDRPFIFSVLSSNLKYQWDEGFLSKLYNICKMDIINFLTEIKSNGYDWIKNNLNAVLYLINTNFDLKICKEICDTILSNGGNKLEEIQEEHVKVLVDVFKRSREMKPDALRDFVQILLQVTVTALKRDSKNIGKLDFLCTTLIDCIKTLKSDSGNDIVFEELSKNYSWCQFTRISLKSGLKIAKDNDNERAFLLRALAAACAIAYKDNMRADYVKTIFEMTTSHSEFTNVMLSNRANIKTELVELLWILIRKNQSVMVVNHIPLYLSAYNATLERSDQILLKICQYYESNGIKLDKYRPYLWGNAAALQYSVKGEVDTALWRQPTTSQVLDILLPELVDNTIKHYPIKRGLTNDLTNPSNDVDRVYDPAFYLSVFTHLLAENNIVACHKIIHSGALALTIIACSSLCEQVRLAAFTVISRFYFHLEATSSKEKLLWMNFIDILRNGVYSSELPIENIRLNGFVATFLARTTYIMTQPLNPLYLTLQAFLMAKPALDLNTIPELLQLYYSSEIEYQAHRHWILHVISDGMKSDLDMDVALKCFLFKMLFDFYTSTLSDASSKSLILKIVRSATKLLKSCMILVNGYALLPWLITATEALNIGDTESTVCIIGILDNILSAFDASKSKNTHHYLMLMKVLQHLKMSFSKNLTIECLKSYAVVLNRTLANKVACSTFTKDHLKSIIHYYKTFLGNVNECEAILQFGSKFVKKYDINCKNDLSPQESLYQLITTWYNVRSK